METYTEKLRRDIQMDERKYAQENRKFYIQILATIAVTVASTIAAMNYLDHHYTPALTQQSNGKP